MTTHHADEKNPADGGLSDNPSMDVLDYVEDRAGKTVEVARKAYDDLHERVYKLATVLVGGGGAVGAYALSKVAEDPGATLWAPLGALSLSWLATAAQLIWVGATSRAASPGNGPKNLLGYYRARVDEKWNAEDAFRITREAELDLLQGRISAYNDGCISRAEAVDRAYKTVAIASPLVPMATALIIRWLG